MTNLVYAYLRASTAKQDASRAKESLKAFARTHGLRIANYVTENASGAVLARPALMKLIDEAEPGDAILIESVDRLSRLNNDEWQKLRSIITEKRLRIISIDLPTSHQMVKTGDEFTQAMLMAINGMMLDMLAAISRKDYLQRRERQAQGIAKRRETGKPMGRPVDEVRDRTVEAMLIAGRSWSQISEDVGCSRSSVSKVAKMLKTASDSEPVVTPPAPAKKPRQAKSARQ
ncbi:recombinase family protein [Pantoea sp. A4]|uniref:recombinase family protein n=1 Tax=Pantoea sp. A4 TaxID=1225184 RepID=UPI000369D603|nr:recombinase family protein [Pantoea sp. A4]